MKVVMLFIIVMLAMPGIVDEINAVDLCGYLAEDCCYEIVPHPDPELRAKFHADIQVSCQGAGCSCINAEITIGERTTSKKRCMGDHCLSRRQWIMSQVPLPPFKGILFPPAA